MGALDEAHTTPCRTAFCRRMSAFADDLGRLARRADRQVARAIDAWERHDPELAAEVAAGDAGIDELAARLEREAFEISLLQAPIARDLRMLHAGKVTAVALERVGDLAAAIAGLVRRVPERSEVDAVRGPLHDLAEVAMRALDDAAAAVSDWDGDWAHGAMDAGTKAITLLDRVTQAAARGSQEPDQRRWVAAAVLVGRHLERAVDNAGEVGRRVCFVTRGERVPAWR